MTKQELLNTINEAICDYFNTNEIEVPEQYEDEYEMAGELTNAIEKTIRKFIKD